MSVVGELPVAAVETQKPKSRKALIIGGIVAAAVTAGGIIAVSTVNQKPGPEAVAKTYLQALADGKGAEAVKVLDVQTATGFNDASFKALEGATERIADIKVGEEAGAKPVIHDRDASIKYGYSVNGKTEVRDFSLRKGDDGAWVIVDGVRYGSTSPNAGSLVQGKDFFKVKVGNGPELKNLEVIKLFPAVYPLSYSGSEFLKLDQVSYFEEGAGKGFKVVPVMEKFQSALDAKFSEFVEGCLASREFVMKLNGEDCGINTDPSTGVFANRPTRTISLDLKVVGAPRVELDLDNPSSTEVVARFKATGTHTYVQFGESEQRSNSGYMKDVEYKGRFVLDDSGQPGFADMVKVPKMWSEDRAMVPALR
jgi:hypothetical protein